MSLPTLKELKNKARRAPEQLSVVKVALLGDNATQLLGTALQGAAVSKGFRLDLWESDYNQVERQLMVPGSEYHGFGADYTVLFQSTHKLLEQHSSLSVDGRLSLAQTRLDFIAGVCDSVNGPVIVYNYPELDDRIFGNYSAKVPSSFIYQVRKLNLGLMELASSRSNLYVADIDSIQAQIGRDRMFAPAVYASTDMVVSLDALPAVAFAAADIIAALRGTFKKCLILDLDNTLWGGIVGDDGWEGIQVGHDLGIGKIFHEFQQWIKKLSQRGIILAVCSKNDAEVAREPFEKNPEMVLRLDDFAVFVANWDNKADNIRYIQRVLNIGFDSMVFIDDNPFERNIVRENLPEVTVPELPEDPALYLEYLYGLNLFETASFSAGDAARTAQYRVEAQRRELHDKFTDEGDYLRSLEMKAVVEGLTPFNLPRVAQLSQRSNQFNLRTVRYDEAALERIGSDKDCEVIAFSLSDRFGDNGLISYVVLRRQAPDTFFIENWVMSCRVLKRGMEDFVLNTIVGHVRAADARKLVGEYIPTPKNKLVAAHYDNLGFTRVQEGPCNMYVLDIAGYAPRECHINN